MDTEVFEVGDMEYPATPYQYEPLPTANHIRLLILDPDVEDLVPDAEDLVCGFIFSKPLSSAPNYVALSYTWGGEKKSQVLRTLDGVLPITGNLHAALRKIASSSKAPLVIWADAICIDQSNNQEKVHQIQLMRQIYEKAEEVAAFLGESEEDSVVAKDLILKLGQTKFDAEADRPAGFKDLERCGLPGLEDEAWAALHRFMRRPWFRRVWIVQECVVAKHVQMYCGDWTAPFDIFMILVVKSIELNLPILRVNHGNLDETGRYEASRGYSCLLALTRLRRKYQLGWQEDLLSLLKQCRATEATRARDNFFALLGLSKDSGDPRLIPDYDESFEEVCLRYTKFLMSSNDPLTLLSLAAPTLAESQFPSWYPDWTKITRRPPLAEIHDAQREPIYHTATNSPAMAKLDQNGRLLTVRGAVFQSLAFAGHDSWSQLSNEPVQTSLLLIWMDMQRACAGMTAYPTGQPPAEALWGAMTMGRETNGGEEAITVATTASYAAARKYFESMPTPAVALAPRISGGQQSMFRLFQAAEVAFVRMGDALVGWKFGFLRSGYIGMVPLPAQTGDIVAILAGARVPFVLRRAPGSDPNRYLLVGECYIQGIMLGEALVTKDLNFEDLYLV